MKMQTKTIGRMPTDHGPYVPGQAYGKKFQVQLYGCVWESKHDNNNTAPATLNTQAGTITPNTTDWKKVTGSTDQWLIDNGYKPVSANNVKDGNQSQHDINSAFATEIDSIETEIGNDSTPASVKGRIKTLETEVGNGGSVDERIAEEGARHYLKSETYTKQEVNGLVSTPHQEYVTVADFASLPVSGSEDTIYRVSNYDGTQVAAGVYSEYAWNGTQYVFLCAKSSVAEVFDISEYHSGQAYATLADALDPNSGGGVPQSLQNGGMSVKFIQGTVQSSENKYVQYRLMADEWSTTVADWQGVDDVPTAGSDNLVKSEGAKRGIESRIEKNHSVNLFNKDSEDFLAGIISDSGYVSGSNYRITPPIYIEGNVLYKANFDATSLGTNNRIAICKEDGTFIEAIQGEISGDFITFSTQKDSYVRLNTTNVVSHPNYFDSYMVCKESEYPVEYVPYRIEPEKDCGLNQKMKNEAKSMIDEASSEILSEAALKDVSVNLFNKFSDNLLLGYIASDVRYVFNDNYRATHPIFVKSNTLYKAGYNADTFGTNNSIAICTEDGTLINVIQGSVSDGYITFTVNADCYVRLNICNVLAYPSYIDTFMVCKASEYPSEYVNYHSTIDNNLGLNSIMKSEVEKEVYSTSVYGTKTKSPNLYDFDNPLGIDGYYNVYGEITHSANHRITHPIKVKAGQKYKATFNTETLGISNNKVLIVSADNTQVLGLIDGIIDTNANTITFSSDADCFVALNIGVKTLASYYQYMICKNEEFPSSFMPYNKSYALNGNIKSRLRGKSVIFTGDSICEGVSDSYGGGWARRIGEKNEMVWLNKGVSGGTIIDKTLVGSSFTISDTDFMNGADYIIFEGGTNDADRIGSILDPNNIPALFGTWSASDYSSNFNNQTFCSAFEKLIKGVVSSFPTTKIGYIVAPKMTRLGSGYAPDYSVEHNNRRAYFEVAIEICKKWGVPVLNLWDNCSMNPMIPSHYSGTNPDENGLYYDGQHPTSKGYDFITPLIESWMESL